MKKKVIQLLIQSNFLLQSQNLKQNQQKIDYQPQEFTQVGANNSLFGMNAYVQQLQDLTNDASYIIQNYYKDYEKKISGLNFSIFNKIQTQDLSMRLNHTEMQQFQQYQQQQNLTEMYQLLKKLKIFKNMSENNFNFIYQNSQLIQVKRNTLFSLNEKLIYIIISGSSEIIKSSNLQKIKTNTILDSKYDGDFFGDLSDIQQLFPYQNEESVDIASKLKPFQKFNYSIKQTYESQIYSKTSEDSILFKINSNIFIQNNFQQDFAKFKAEINFLKTIDLFYIVPLFQLVKFQPDIIRLSFSLGQTILNQGEEIKYLYFIYKGCVRVIYDDQKHNKNFVKIKEDKLDYKKKYLIKTMAAGEYFGQRSILDDYERDRKKINFKYEQEISHLKVISDSPKLDLLCINRILLERFDCQYIFKQVISQIIRSQEFDNIDKEVKYLKLQEIVKNYLQWLQQNLYIEKEVKNKL